MALRAVIVGAGWAGEGHAIALREAGVEVVALCGRTPESAHARAQQLAIPTVRFDLRAALEEFRPDIVAIGTPGDSHRAMVELAVNYGCHIVCEKPLATSGEDARAMLAAVERAGVKHGYAATGCYAPAVLYAEALVARGEIGLVHEIESYERFVYPPPVPYSWTFDWQQGGGLLANSFTHKLAQVLRASGGTLVGATGTATVIKQRMPVAPPMYDSRQLFGPISGWDAAQATEWREAESDMAYTAILDLAMPQGHTARAVIQESLLATGPYPQQLILYGDKGTLAMGNGHHDQLVRIQRHGQAGWEELPPPSELLRSLPQVEDPVQRAWNLFFRAFVADLHGEGPASYPTFHDGWMATEVIDRVLAGRALPPVAQGV